MNNKILKKKLEPVKENKEEYHPLSPNGGNDGWVLDGITGARRYKSDPALDPS